MISDKLLHKLEKTVSKMDLNKLSELSIMQGPDGSYFLFNKYTIRKNNDCFIVIKDSIAGNKSFNILKNAVAWCTFDQQNSLYESNRILTLDNNLASVDSEIQIHQHLAKRAKNLEEKLIYLAKMGEEKMERKHITEELAGYVTSSRIWQNKRLNKSTH
jgi:hypothetical protein